MQQRKEQMSMIHDAHVLILSDHAIKGMDLGIEEIALTIQYDIPNEFDTVLRRIARMRRGYCIGRTKLNSDK